MSEINEILNESKLKKEIIWVIHAFNNENDFTFCLIGVSFLEACLKDFLLGKLRKGSTSKKLLDHNGALGGIFSKAQLAYAMKYIEKKEFQDILTLADIRNEFAHLHIQKNFNNPDIKNMCKKLHLSVLLPPDQIKKTDRNGYEEMLKTAKARFSMAVVTISNKLLYSND